MEKIEKALLGSIIDNVDTCVKVFELLTPQHFTYKNKIVFNEIIKLNDKNAPIDLITITQALKESGNLELVGGMAYVSEIAMEYVSPTKIETYCYMVLENYVKTQIKAIGETLVKKTSIPTIDSLELLREAENALNAISNNIIKAKEESVGVIKDNIVKEIGSVLASGKSSGVPTSLSILNRYTNGWQKSDLVILAGRPAMGKTSLGIDFALHPAINQIPTAFFSLEMSKEQLVGRILSQLSFVDVQKIVNKTLSESEFNQLIQDGKALDNVPLFIDDTPSLTLYDLRNKARRLKREKKIELLVVDYLQLMRGKGNSREQEISEISRGLKALAKELNIPVIALSQLSRKCEDRADKKPLLSDLRESGAIEQDADMVVFCHRPEYYGLPSYQYGNDELPSNGLFMIIISKFRNGSTGEIKARFIGENTKIKDY